MVNPYWTPELARAVLIEDILVRRHLTERAAQESPQVGEVLLRIADEIRDLAHVRFESLEAKKCAPAPK